MELKLQVKKMPWCFYHDLSDTHLHTHIHTPWDLCHQRVAPRWQVCIGSHPNSKHLPLDHHIAFPTVSRAIKGQDHFPIAHIYMYNLCLRMHMYVYVHVIVPIFSSLISTVREPGTTRGRHMVDYHKMCLVWSPVSKNCWSLEQRSMRSESPKRERNVEYVYMCWWIT